MGRSAPCDGEWARIPARPRRHGHRKQRGVRRRAYYPHVAVTRRLLRWLALAVLPVLGACYSAVNLAPPAPPGVAPPSLWPWRPWTQDLQVYLFAANDLLAGVDFYTHVVTFPYLYPPIAALLAIPLTLLPWSVAQFVWTALNGVLTLAVLRRLGMPGWSASVAAAAVLLLTDPFMATLRLGQLGILLMAMVVLDLLGPTGGRRRILPGGVLIGLAAGLKLTPGVFIVHLFLIGRRRDALVAAGTFLGTVLLGIAVAPRPALGYWARLAGGDSGANPDAFGWIGNISVTSATQRFLGVEQGGRIGLLLAGALVLLALAAAWRCHRTGRPVLALGVLGLASSLANPIAWSHHLTWVLPLGYAAWRATGRVRRPLPQWQRVLTLVVVLWCLINPQQLLGGAPWARREIFEYSIAQKWFAAGPDVAAALLAVALLFVPGGRTPQRQRPGDDDPDEDTEPTPDAAPATEAVEEEPSGSTRVPVTAGDGARRDLGQGPWRGRRSRPKRILS
ncbi:hypothetical protein CGZ94_20585 [Enemella evansiae]|uniref:DUF2029 domain-containing protein n=1 Tax=Enemella evansiae TaxID=2016499 RepID=A0A255FVZ0_9ACTN|nr:hypothetical protein CGZ94_20585 [Enemella evansiae]